MRPRHEVAFLNFFFKQVRELNFGKYAFQRLRLSFKECSRHHSSALTRVWEERSMAEQGVQRRLAAIL